MNLVYYTALFAATASAIWPIPSSYSHGEGLLWVDESVQFTYNGAVAGQVSHITATPLPNKDGTYQYQAHLGSYGHSSGGVQNSSSSSSSDKIVNKAIERTLETLFKQNFVPWKFHPRFADFEPDASSAEKVLIKTVALKQNGTDPEDILKPATGSVDESYALTVSEAGDVTISAVTSVGLARGLTTFTQLFFEHTDGGVYSELAPVSITDAPKFPWRGLNLDTSRTFKSMEDIYRTIDALAYSKFNRLHWHITDSQSWPLELPSMPEVADKGAYIGFQKYSPADVQAVQEYGALVGVEVVMEIDQPGHTASIWYSHPELIAAFEILPNWDTYAAEPPSGTLKLNSTAVYDFLEKLFDDLRDFCEGTRCSHGVQALSNYVFPHNCHTRPPHFLAGIISCVSFPFRYYIHYYALPLTSFSTSIPHSAHCVPFIVQKGIWIGSALTPLATNLSLISLSLGLAVI